MSVESEVTRIKNAVTSAYTACKGMGAVVPTGYQPLKNLPTVISNTINILGTNINDFVALDSNGSLTLNPDTLGYINDDTVTVIGPSVLYHKFSKRANLTQVSLNGVETIENSGMREAFAESELETLELNNLRTVEALGCYGMCYNCKSLTSINLPLLEVVNGGTATPTASSPMYTAFAGTGVTNVEFPSLYKISNVNGMAAAFQNCADLYIISFPMLTDVNKQAFGSAVIYYIFRNCPDLTEIHFRADMETVISTMTGFNAKWGATNATIYFDL